ncbi:hypothetical protein MP638_006105 [Amoeboaphelidium occidentale]|nr:hypothetical protein MP638_006105 [Amoeboaphelidium occidentale]
MEFSKDFLSSVEKQLPTPPKADGSSTRSRSQTSAPSPAAKASDKTKQILRDHQQLLQEQRQDRRMSISTLWLHSQSPSGVSGGSANGLPTAANGSLSADEIHDDMYLAQKKLSELKTKISSQSKRNFLLERDVRYLDSRIALLIQNRMQLDEELTADEEPNEATMADGRRHLYGNLFFLLQTEPRLVAHLCRLVTLSEMDTLLQTVMFTLYGNQYEQREEHLLLTMFQAVLSNQFDNTSDFGSLLRANTPVSRMMTTYTRRGPGQQYLKYVLNESINSVIDDNQCLEINPLTIYNQLINNIETETGKTCDWPRGVTQDEAMQRPEVQEVMKPRAKLLMDTAEMLLSTIIDSLQEVPYGIRWICKQIKQLTKRKFPDADEWSICSLIGGFFFLRFINPAIVTPQSYMIVEKSPGQNAKRTLTLIAKLIQNLANKPSYAKEMYMMELSPFIDKNKNRISLFLMDLCDVDDFYESLEMDQYVAMSKKDLSINITLNEIYNTHALLLKHMDVIAPVKNVVKKKVMTPEESYDQSCKQLRQALDGLGEAPAQLPRKDNKSIQLMLFSRWEVAPILFPHLVSKDKRTSSLSDADILCMDTKQLVVQLIRKQADASGPYGCNLSIKNVPEHFSQNLVDVNEILNISCLSVDPSIVRRAVRAKQNLRILEERYNYKGIHKKDGYRDFAYQVYEEFKSLQGVYHKVERELDSLNIVYKTICDHNKFLKGQLEYYKSYLQNVRIQASGGSSSRKIGQFLFGKSSNTTNAQSPNSGLATPQKGHTAGPFKFSHAQLEKDGVITESGVPENRRANIYFSVKSPLPGSFVIALLYKGREKPILEVDLKLDDLLEKQQENVQTLDFDYVQLNVNKTLHLLNKNFLKR